MTPLPNLPLLYDGDSYLIHLDEDHGHIRLLFIERFANNENSEPDIIPFFYLDERGRHLVMQQIQRRYPGRSVKVQ